MVDVQVYCHFVHCCVAVEHRLHHVAHLFALFLQETLRYADLNLLAFSQNAAQGIDHDQRGRDLAVCDLFVDAYQKAVDLPHANELDDIYFGDQSFVGLDDLG